MTYHQALEYIASLQARGWRLGLDRMEEFVRRAELTDAIGAPGGPQFIHIAGTNGKGSTTAYVQSLLIEHGYQTGAFFSPFVIDPRERIQLNRHLISKNAMARLTTWLKPIGESLSETEFEGVTEFEFKTALGFSLWKRKKCDWVALEVGLGGRLDATNVVTPRCSIVTSISRDHVGILGDSIAAIAVEKAGIIKPGVPVVLGDLPADAIRVMRVIAEENGSEIIPRQEFPVPVYGITGAKQPHNFDLACTALRAAGLKLDREKIDLAARNAFIPGRFQVETMNGREVVFDGAHNAEAADVLLASLRARYPDKNLLLVANVLLGHEITEFFDPLKGAFESVYVVPIDSPRARPVTETVKALAGFAPSIYAFDSIRGGLDAALNDASDDDVVVVTGSYYLVGEALRGL